MKTIRVVLCAVVCSGTPSKRTGFKKSALDISASVKFILLEGVPMYSDVFRGRGLG